MKIGEGLEVLELKRDNRILNSVLIWDENDMALIDTGLPGMFLDIIKEIEAAGTYFERLKKVIITHHDIDHIGSLTDIVNKSKGKIEVIAHTLEAPYINGEEQSLKMTPERLKAMPREERARFKALKTEVDTEVSDGEILPYFGGITIIHTPGHTHGHICLYLHKYKTLVTGDALNVEGGQLIGPKPEYTYDMPLALTSLKKLLDYDIETIICYHGGIFKGDISNRISKLSGVQ